MLELLIALLISLGGNATTSTQLTEFKAKDPATYEQAQKIYSNGNYRVTDSGGVVIIETGGD